MTNASIFNGGCLCGLVRYQSTAAPVRGVICHCTQCRKHSGAPALAFVHFRRESFQWLGPEPARYRSSATAERGFCPVCGSTISMHESILAERVQIAVGSLDDPNLVQIDDHVWTEHQIAWFQVTDTLPRFLASSDAVPTGAAQPAGEGQANE